MSGDLSMVWGVIRISFLGPYYDRFQNFDFQKQKTPPPSAPTKPQTPAHPPSPTQKPTFLNPNHQPPTTCSKKHEKSKKNTTT